MDTFLTVLNEPDIKAIGCLIFLDLVLGVAAAIKQQEYEWERLGRFLLTNVLPYILVYAAIKLVAYEMPEWEAVRIAVLATIVMTLAGSIALYAKRLGLNIPIPGV